jgi:hypothetical protein
MLCLRPRGLKTGEGLFQILSVCAEVCELQLDYDIHIFV